MNAHVDLHAETLRRPRPVVSDATRAKMAAAKRGRRIDAVHRARIATALRRWWHSEPDAHLRGVARLLTAEQAADYRTLRAVGDFSKAEALVKVGRPDLIGWRPAAKLPRRVWRSLTAAERRSYHSAWAEANSWQDGLVAIGRGDLI